MEIIEKEIKLEVIDFDKLLNLLNAKGARFLNKAKEKTIRFDTENMDLEQKGVFIRVRSGSKNTITLKEKIYESSDVRARKETEMEIENVDEMAYILQKIGLSNVKIMEKFRVNFEYKNVKLSIDELPFGNYLEIEGSEGDIFEVAAELGFNPEEKVLGTYWDVFDDYKKKNGLTIENIEFDANFQSKLLSKV